MIDALEHEKIHDEEEHKKRKLHDAAQNRRGAIRGTMSPWTLTAKKKPDNSEQDKDQENLQDYKAKLKSHDGLLDEIAQLEALITENTDQH